MQFTDDIKENCLISGGHFMLGDNGPVLNEGTIRSFQEAVSHYKNNLNKGVGLGLLINDIGATCTASSCSILRENKPSTPFQLPKEYSEILQKMEVAEDRLIIFWEKHMRNRGKKLLHKLLNQQNNKIVDTDDGYVFSCSASKLDIILTRKSPKDKYGTPACPLIMCAYYLELKKHGYLASLNFYYVGEDNELNVPNHFVIEKGAFLSKQFTSGIDIKNVYLFENEFLKNWVI